MASFGSTTRFAIEIGKTLNDTGSSRRVDIWAAGLWLTCDDNNAYVPFLAGVLQHALGALLVHPEASQFVKPFPELSAAENYRRLREGVLPEDEHDYGRRRFMHWGPITDNVSALLFLDSGTASIPFMFNRADHHDPAERGRLFVAELPVWELAAVMHEAAWALVWDWADRSKWDRPRGDPKVGI